MPQDPPDATLSAVFEDGYQSLLDEFVEAEGVWNPQVELLDEAPTNAGPRQFHHTWETDSLKERLTYILPLSVGTRTASHLDNYISEAQTIRRLAANLLWSYEPAQWGGNSDVNSLIKTHPYWKRNNLKAGNKQANVNKVGEAFGAWAANDRSADTSALPQFGSGNYLCIRGDYIEVWDDAAGVTIAVGGVQHQPPDPGRDEEFQLVCGGGDYQQKVLDAVAEGVVNTGRSEVHHRDGEWFLHLTVWYNQPKYDHRELERWVGIDLGTVALYTAAVVERAPDSPKGNGVDVLEVAHGPGSELMDTRRTQQQRLSYLQEEYGYEVASEKLGQQLAEHSKQLEHEYANEIVALADAYAPCGIVFETLKGIKGLGWSHLWAYFRFKQVITYKAHQRGIPTVTLGKSQTQHTSQDCSACGRRTSEADDDGRITRAQFRCDDCGYGPVDADSNAAINIATRRLSTLFSECGRY
ncbi:zinc ribbon domain-containing protein [Halocatena pleomorpha]|uniref:Transposase n=1 Tax=Halocatena pleomorpha TaxID=1785090 RepID=A0A3P3RMJ6_9EURY|nr:zinc ribbon domain-containing protein [Halocatena pleomorpha]RRJ34090.1 transposase [Halocatena pleomorpha]